MSGESGQSGGLDARLTGEELLELASEIETSQIESFEKLDGKAVQLLAWLLGSSGIVSAILALLPFFGIGSLGQNLSGAVAFFQNVAASPYTRWGLLFFGTAVIFSLLGYNVGSVGKGMDAESFPSMSDYDTSRADELDERLEKVRQNGHAIRRKGTFVFAALISLTYAVTLLAVGVFSEVGGIQVVESNVGVLSSEPTITVPFWALGLVFLFVLVIEWFQLYPYAGTRRSDREKPAAEEDRSVAARFSQAITIGPLLLLLLFVGAFAAGWQPSPTIVVWNIVLSSVLTAVLVIGFSKRISRIQPPITMMRHP